MGNREAIERMRPFDFDRDGARGRDGIWSNNVTRPHSSPTTNPSF